jgi:hypothetical protein
MWLVVSGFKGQRVGRRFYPLTLALSLRERGYDWKPEGWEWEAKGKGRRLRVFWEADEDEGGYEGGEGGMKLATKRHEKEVGRQDFTGGNGES